MAREVTRRDKLASEEIDVASSLPSDWAAPVPLLAWLVGDSPASWSTGRHESQYR